MNKPTSNNKDTIKCLVKVQERAVGILTYVERNIRHDGVQLKGYYTKQKCDKNKK